MGPGCVCGGYFRVMAYKMWYSCLKTDGLSPGGVVKHNVLQEDLSQEYGNIRQACPTMMIIGGGLWMCDFWSTMMSPS